MILAETQGFANEIGYKLSMRESVRKRHAPLLRLLAVANGDAEIRDLVMVQGQRVVDYGPRERFAGWLREALRKLVAQAPAAGAKPPPSLIDDQERAEMARYGLTDETVPRRARVAYEIELPSRPVSVSVGADGRISSSVDFVRDQVLPALVGCDVRRIKVCPVCDRLFLALRLDQPACSRQCGHTLRSRKFRLNAPRYEKNRKENRRRAAARKALRRTRR